MTATSGRNRPPSPLQAGPARRRRWLRWALAAVAALVALLVLAVAAWIKLQPAPARLTLPVAAVLAPAGPVDGTWQVAAGSTAGFRVQESALGFRNDAVGRTQAVTGTIILSAGQVTSARLRVDLTAIRVNGKVQPQFAASLGVRRYPAATFTLTRPVPLSPSFTTGSIFTATAAGRLAMHGTARPVTVTLRARRDGSAVQLAGAIPVAFRGWAIRGPKGYGLLGSLADHGIAEFLLILRHQ
jgi:polyisoprenoid-binding protein YceI